MLVVVDATGDFAVRRGAGGMFAKRQKQTVAGGRRVAARLRVANKVSKERRAVRSASKTATEWGTSKNKDRREDIRGHPNVENINTDENPSNYATRYVRRVCQGTQGTRTSASMVETDSGKKKDTRT